MLYSAFKVDCGFSGYKEVTLLWDQRQVIL